MPDLTQTIDPGEVLTKTLSEPSYASQILTVAARVLPYGDSVGSVNAWNLHDALTTAEAEIVGTLPEAVRHTASLRARNALPPLAGISRGEYAIRLRAAAKGL